MRIVPIVFAIDGNVVVPCAVTLTSLLLNANPDTFYNIYILHAEEALPREARENLLKAFSSWEHGKIEFVNIVDNFDKNQTFKAHHSIATYYRFLLPSLFTQYDKVLYADVDIIFQQDLYDIYNSSCNNDELIGAVRDLAFDDKVYFKSTLPNIVGKTVKTYFNAGFLVLNLKQMRIENIQSRLEKEAKTEYPEHDQDVLNLVCAGREEFLPMLYNFQPHHFTNYYWGKNRNDYNFSRLMKHATIHYTGLDKPWKSLECVLADAWWHYYRRSPYYNDMYYFTRQYSQIETCRRDYKKANLHRLFLQMLVHIKHKILD